jgi:DNA replication protein DnaC
MQFFRDKSFNFGPTTIDRLAIEEIMHSEFIKTNRNTVLAGPRGIGKTQVVKDLALNAVIRGRRVLFTTAATMVIDT